MPSKKTKNIEIKKETDASGVDVNSLYGRGLFEQIPVGMALISSEGRYIDVNSEFCRITGRTRDEILKLNYLDITPEKYHEQEMLQTRLLESTGHYGPYEKEYIHKDGHLVPVRLQGLIIKYKDVDLVWSSVEDITESKNAEAELRRSEEKYRRLIRYSPVGMVILKQGRIHYANIILANTLGFDNVDEILDIPMMNFIHPEYREIAKERLTALFSREDTTVKTMEEKFITKDGREIEALVVGHSIIYEGSVAVQGYVFDITESRKAQKEIKESEEKFRTLIDSATDAFFLSDFSGNLIQVNRAACESLGYSQEELLKMTVGDVDKNFKTAEHLDELWSALVPGKHHMIDSIHVRKDGSEFPVEVNIGVLQLKGQDVILGFARDISERKKTELRLNKLNRIYAVISQINQMIVRTIDINEVLQKSCEISIEYGKFLSAWIGLYDRGRTNLITAAFHGERIDFLSGGGVTGALDKAAEKDIIAKAINEDGNCFSNDIEKDAVAGIIKQEALSCGYKSMIALPLKTFDTVIGVFVLFSPVKDFFDQEEIKLLIEVATDISFAIQALELEKMQKNAETALRESENRLRLVLEGSNDGFWDWNIQTGRVDFSSRWLEMLGYGSADITPHISTWEKIIHPDDNENVLRLLKDHLEGRSPYYEAEYRVLTKSLEWKWILDRGKVVEFDEDGKPLRAAGTHTDISERKINEQLLKESQERFRTAFFTSPDSINLNRLADGVYVEINEGFTRITGYTKEDVIGKSSLEINIWRNPEDRKKLVEGLKNFGVVNNLEAEFMMKDGSILDGLMSASLIMINNIPHVLSITREISQIKAAQNELHKSREEYRMFFEQDLTGDFISTADGKLINCNPAFLKILGFKSKEEALGADIKSFYPDPSERSAMIEKLKEKKSLENYRMKMKRVDGRDLFLIENIIGKFSESGELEYIQGYLLDDTERTLAEEELRKLSGAVEQSPASILITDLQGRIEYVNPKFTEVTGFTFDDVKGKNPSILKSGHTGPEEYREMWNAIRDGKTWRGELLNKKKDGSFFWSSVLISPVKNSTGETTHYLSVEEDITPAKNYQRQLIEAKEKAENSDKLKTEFLAQMSHEIRSPIQVILSFISLLEEEVKDKIEPELMTSFRSIHSSSSRIIRTIDAILNMSELQTGTYEAVFKEIDIISKILQPLINEYDQLAKLKNISLRLELIARNTIITADEYSIIQIFSNLIDNAIKYTPRGFVKVRVFTNDRHNLTVEIEDTGIGISKEFLPNIFKPFVQEEQGYTRSFEGNGLGLALVKKYCELNNADISAESEKNRGSIFRIEFRNN